MAIFKAYKIVASADRGQFENMVSDLLRQGYTLQGGVFVVKEIQGLLFCQALALPA